MKREIGWAALAAATLALCAPAAAQDPATTDVEFSEEDARARIESWPENKRTAAEDLIARYGAPDEITEERLTWMDQDDWSQISLLREGRTEHFPTTHESYVEHTVRYSVPQEKAGELIKFHTGLSVDRQAGTLSARSDSETANMLALNLAHELVEGKQSVSSARTLMREELRKEMTGKRSRYTEELMFEVSEPVEEE